MNAKKDNNQTRWQDKGGFCETTKDAEFREKRRGKYSFASFRAFCSWEKWRTRNKKMKDCNTERRQCNHEWTRMDTNKGQIETTDSTEDRKKDEGRKEVKKQKQKR